MPTFKALIVALTFLSFIGGADILLGNNSSIAKTKNLESIKPKKEEESNKLKSLPPEIQQRIKSRKRAIIKTRGEIRALSPEKKAELQANIETWFKSLPLEKQVEIKIRMGGGIPTIEKIRQRRERNLSEKTKVEKEEVKEKPKEIKKIKKTKTAKEEKKTEKTKIKIPEEKAEIKIKATPAPSIKEDDKDMGDEKIIEIKNKPKAVKEDLKTKKKK